MNHPEELLAGYVDGTLTERERAGVEAHLPACETCREEIALASRAVAALEALPEEPVPFGVMNPVTAEIGRRTEPARVPWRARLQWAAGIAVAAALVAFVAVALPDLGGGGGGAESGPVMEAASPAEADRPPTAGVGVAGLERQLDVDYDAGKLESLASEVAAQLKSGQALEATPGAFASDTDLEAATACLLLGSDLTAEDRLARLIEASFEGTPAYLGAFLESPGAGQPPNEVVIWVVAKSDCAFLSFASKPIR